MYRILCWFQLIKSTFTTNQILQKKKPLREPLQGAKRIGRSSFCWPAYSSFHFKFMMGCSAIHSILVESVFSFQKIWKCVWKALWIFATRCQCSLFVYFLIWNCLKSVQKFSLHYLVTKRSGLTFVNVQITLNVKPDTEKCTKFLSLSRPARKCLFVKISIQIIISDLL